MSKLFKVFGDGTRIRIMAALNCREMCVCDIAVLLDMTKSAVSHQLKVLRDNNLVKFQKKRKARLLFPGRWPREGDTGRCAGTYQ